MLKDLNPFWNIQKTEFGYHMYIILVGFFLAFSAQARASLTAAELTANEHDGSILAKNGDEYREYPDIIGIRDGAYRTLTQINGLPALVAGTRDLVYFTLKGRGAELLIDCAYVDERNIYNGARVQVAECDLDQPLDSEYLDIGFDQASKWTKSVFSFSTRTVIETDKPESFLLGKIGGVEIYDRYTSLDSINAYAPEKLIKGNKGCYRLSDRPAFLVFLKGDENPRYIDVVTRYDPMVMKRLDYAALNSAAVEACPDS